MAKIVQTAGRNALGEFAPQFAHFNDDVLFGENWNNQDIDVKTRSIITVVALMAQGMTTVTDHGDRGGGSKCVTTGSICVPMVTQICLLTKCILRDNL